jgi:RNA polymerase sigma-70 factor (ECF subfamily)
MKADLELVQQVKEGDQLAYAELVKRHQKALLRLVLKFARDLDLAEDILQDSFVKAYQKINQFEGRSSFKSWLYRIAINTAKNKLRSLKKEQVSLDDVQVSQSAEAESALLREAVQKRMKEEIDELPDKQKTALTLRVYEDMSFKEIAQIMDCPYDTAKANYRHGLMKLKAAMGGDELLSNWLKFNDEEQNIIQKTNNTMKYEH